ncbi:glycosyl hydrolase family 28-related protein [Dyadobacter aurulentus]|uniref:glycosyl hydrolase family 28-related protein n=1 Tax=Dyadobacter sp. UC 10 TaxID=2605428 RepID=UPI0011F2C40C|nr:right-handed parallel beta-helix repeat-containing protein [Dyadobacter sp. UC 10]KAA0991304.1 hypothetical protein FXO21_14605 [Dyadobacter sp. UC 10]
MRSPVFLIIIFFLQSCNFNANAQRRVLAFDSTKHSLKVKKSVILLNIQKDFGATPNDKTNDHAAFQAAADFINKRKGHCKLLIPKGTYIVGKQDLLKNNAYLYRGSDVLQILNCNNVKIAGEPGTILKYDVGFRFGSFNPADGLSTNITMDCTPKTKTSADRRADLGRCIVLVNSANIQIDNVVLDGNFYAETLNNMNSFKLKCIESKNSAFMADKINIGGGYGDCNIQLAHYGIFVLKSGNVTISNSTTKRFGTDGIQIANSHELPAEKNIKIVNCVVDFNARTGIALTGGDKIDVINTSITNTGGCVYASTGTGVDIEAQRDDKKQEKLVTNVNFNNCKFKNNSSGEILAKFGLGSSDVTFENCNIHSSTRAVNVGRKNVGYRFINNKIGGNKVILLDDQKVDASDRNHTIDASKIKTSRSSEASRSSRTSAESVIFRGNVIVN